MSRSFNAWLLEQLPHLIQLAKLPFDQVSHEKFCQRIGWEVVREDWYPETCFEVHFDDVERRLIAVYDDGECGIGIGLYALGEEASAEVLTTRKEFDEKFQAMLALLEPHFESAASCGTYRHGGQLFKYAYWPFA